jgi:hypothetical protein
MFENFMLDNIETRMKRNIFLDFASTKYYLRNAPRQNLWRATDKESLYTENLKIQPDDWFYRTNEVRYSDNSEGYRTKEFDTINWQQSIVIFGCSSIYGVGLDDKHTISAQLEKILGMPVINMGQGGTSINYNLHNSMILADRCPAPKAVIMGWPIYDRCVYYGKDSIVNYGPWNLEENNYMDLWCKDENNSKANAVMAQKIFQLVWKNRSPIYQFSFNLKTAKLLDCNYIKRVDQARDLLHHGVTTNLKSAEILADALKTCI